MCQQVLWQRRSLQRHLQGRVRRIFCTRRRLLLGRRRRGQRLPRHRQPMRWRVVRLLLVPDGARGPLQLVWSCSRCLVNAVPVHKRPQVHLSLGLPFSRPGQRERDPTGQCSVSICSARRLSSTALLSSLLVVPPPSLTHSALLSSSSRRALTTPPHAPHGKCSRTAPTTTARARPTECSAAATPRRAVVTTPMPLAAFPYPAR